MPTKSFRIEESLYNRMVQFINSMAGRYNRSEVLATAIYMYHDQYGTNPAKPDNPVVLTHIEKDKERFKAAAWAHKLTKAGKLKKEITIYTTGVEIKIARDTAITYKPPNIIEFELFRGCHNQLVIHEEECAIDEKDNIYLDRPAPRVVP